MSYNYRGPITMYTEQIVKDIVEKQNGYLIECVRNVGFDIDKDELAKALQDSRDQYRKGYEDGYADGFRRAMGKMEADS